MNTSTYTVPTSALIDRGRVATPDDPIWVDRVHDRDGICCETQPEYDDMCRMRIGGWTDGTALAVLAHHQQMIDDERAAMLQAEIDAWNEGHPTTRDGEKPWLFLDPFDIGHLYVPDYGYSEGRPVYETKLLQRDEVRVPWLVKQVEGWHEAGEHSKWLHAFCTYCRVEEEFAEASLRWWLAGNPGAEVPRGEARADDEGHPLRKDYVKVRDLRDLPPASWLIKDLVPEHTVGYLAGMDATYKTFAALNMSLTLARGGRRVLYIMGEGIEHTLDRVDAWLERRGEEPDAEWLDNLDIRTSTVDLFNAGHPFDEMVKMAEAQQYTLIVVDTIARSVGDGNQDSASDMSVVTGRLDRLKRASGGTVLVLAHTGKDATRGIRGSTAFRANADFTIMMERREGDTVRMSTKAEHGGKMKDGGSGIEMMLGTLEVGRSIVLVPADQKPAEKWLSDNLEARVLGVLVAAHGHDALTTNQIRTAVLADRTDKPASLSGIHKALTGLIGEDKVTQEKTGTGVGAKAYYRVAEHVIEGMVA